jgi:small subunit ribosomal protein S8
MLITDPIGDMIIRIKNAFLAGHDTVMIPHSKVNESIAKILTENNYVNGFKVIEKKPQSDLKVTLRYVDNLAAITEVKRLSRPGRRLYSKVKDIPIALNRYGITIVSTSKGIMTDKDARKQHVSGELLCQIW